MAMMNKFRCTKCKHVSMIRDGTWTQAAKLGVYTCPVMTDDNVGTCDGKMRPLAILQDQYKLFEKSKNQ